MRPKKPDNGSRGRGQSYVGIGKLVMWAAVVVVVFLMKLCGFDVRYPTGTP